MANLQDIIADEWRSRAPELADWAMRHLVNRKDVWGQYSVLTPSERRQTDRSYKAMTLPAVNQRDESKARVTLDKLTRHFASRRKRKPQLIGLHAKSQDTTSLWVGIDIDNHSDDASSGDDLGRRNLNAAVNWYHNLQKQGYDPLLLDSNGAGGYHLWVLFKDPAPTEHVFAFAMATTADWQEQQLDKQPETFPKRVKEDSLGSWFRLPGLHHTRDHHARIWHGDDGLDDPWLTGHSAIDAMIACVPGPPPPAVSADKSESLSERRQNKNPNIAKPGDTPKPRGRQSFARSKLPRICIDLDGVLASRTGNNDIGPPIEGAVEFTRQLHASAELVIFTARFSTTRGKARSQKSTQALLKRIERWLTLHGFSWDSINTATAKPIATAYIDDRAVACQPECDGLEAFDKALAATQELVKGKHA